MYWAEKEAGVIRRANLDGSNIETLVTAEESIIAFSLHLELGWSGMYWTEWNRESETGTLRWAYVDGTNVEVITEIEAQIVPAANSGTLWLNLDLDTIQGLDGSTISPGIEGPQDIAIDVSENKMYWTDKRTSTIRRANLDGTQVRRHTHRPRRARGHRLGLGRGQDVLDGVGRECDPAGRPRR